MINSLMEQFISNKPNNEIRLWRPADNEKSFRKNSKRLSNDWIYRNKEITYSYNEQGFRERSFDEVDWKESVVVFGCSNVEGIGLALEDTLAKQLEKIIERPVINLGIGGTGVDLACWNSLILHESYPTPKAIVQVWSSLDRYADYEYKSNSLSNFMPSGNNYYSRLNWHFRSKKYIETDRVLWRDKVAYAEGTYFGTTGEFLSQSNIQKFLVTDMARDLSHPGIESNRVAAESCAEQLKLLI
jgi:hypothetical protein